MDRRQILQNLFGYQSEEEDANSNYELDHQANDVSDGGLEHENEGKAENKREPEVNTRVADLLGSSRSPDSEKGKDAAALSAAIFHEVFGDSDDEEPGEYAVLNQTNENTVSPKSIGNYAEESQVENAGPDEGAIYECEEESTETKVKGKEAASSDVFEIPLHPPPVDPDQMATIKLSNIIAIDPNPFDPATYVEDDFYVTDESGTKKCIPHTNIIRWREVTNPDGTTSVQSNARFTTWSDGSLQLLIGNEAFDVSEQDARDIQSQLFHVHGKGIYHSQGRISRKMKFMPSSLSSNSHRSLTALVESRHKKVNKVRQYTPEIDPERMVEQNEKVERLTTKASKQLSEKKKKVTNKYRPKGYKEHQLSPGFLEDAVDENAATLHQLDLDLQMEAAAEKRIITAKKGPKDTRKSTSSSVKLTRGSLLVSKEEKFELEHGFKRKEAEGTILRKEVEEEPNYEDSDVEAEGPKGKKKLYVESDEDKPSRRTATRRQIANVYDGDDE